MEQLKQKFEKMGARVTFDELTTGAPIRINVIRDNKGEIFNIEKRKDVDIIIPDLQVSDRHLLLLAKFINGSEPENVKFLCGHDEREWFSCQTPDRGVSNVKTAKLALLPDEVRESQKKHGTKTKDLTKRKSAGHRRQGEWLFVPVDIEVNEEQIRTKEPLEVTGRGGGSSPHIAEFAYIKGGISVYVVVVSKFNKIPESDRDRLNAGLTFEEKIKYIKRNPKSKQWNWAPRTINPELYIKGALRHRDHETINFQKWHRVYLNTEIRGRFNVFMD